MAGIRLGDKREGFPSPPNRMKPYCTPFVLCSQYVLLRTWVLACFDPSGPHDFCRTVKVSRLEIAPELQQQSSLEASQQEP
jgi:hypothetical protein